MAKECALSTCYLPRGGLPRNSVDRITDRPDMTSAVDRGRKASTQTNETNRPRIWHVVLTENFDRSECLTKENIFILFLSYHLHV